MDLATGRRNRVPVAQLIRRTLKEIEPHARELGSDRELEGIREILAHGNGADRQRRVFNANRDIVEVVREIADATEARCRGRLSRARLGNSLETNHIAKLDGRLDEGWTTVFQARAAQRFPGRMLLPAPSRTSLGWKGTP